MCLTRIYFIEQRISHKKRIVFRREHVPKYHQWMKSNELLQLTASEPLSLDEEYEMQKNWTIDSDKCTFIVIDKQLMLSDYDILNEDDLQLKNSYIDNNGISLEQSVKYMCGDVNAFLTMEEEEEEEKNGTSTKQVVVAEMEVMIAEIKSRRKGIAQEAVILLMNYIQRELNVQKFQVKISKENESSLKLFKEKIGFEYYKYNECFGEYHLIYPTNLPIPILKKELIKLVSNF